MQLSTERQTAKTVSEIRESTADTAATDVLPGITALKPPHLALAGQRVEPLEKVTAGDRAIIKHDRKKLCTLLAFGVRHGFTEEEGLLTLLQAPYIEQAVNVRTVLKQTLQRFAEALGEDKSLFQLTAKEPGYGDGELGWYIEPADPTTLIHCTAPDPLLSDWFSRFTTVMSNHLGFYTASDIADYELEMQLDMAGIETAHFEEDREQISTLLASGSIKEICKLLAVTEGNLAEMWGEDEIPNALSHFIELSRLADQKQTKADDSIQVLRADLNALIETHPRLAYEPTIKQLLVNLPDIERAAAVLSEHAETALESKGDRYAGEHFMVVNGELPDACWEMLRHHEQHIWEAGESGCWSINPAHPKAVEVAQAYVQMTSKFLDVCEYE